MNVLIACEESQRVCTAFRERGHNAFSCDIQPCSGGHPEWHIQGDVREVLNPDIQNPPGSQFYGIYFRTMDKLPHRFKGGWDLIIAHPPCTHLCSAGQHWFSRGFKDPALREEAFGFFMLFVNADAEKIAVENPVGIVSKRFRKFDQAIQPYEFGDPYTKKTCLWLKNLPPLVPTDVLTEPEGGWLNKHISGDGKYHGFVNHDENGKIMSWNDPETAKIRSKTFPGIARAMAEQWG